LENITESVVVYSDANTFFKPDAIKKLIRHFEDNEIAGVCGELQLVDVDSSDNKDSAYWKLERFLKYHEGKINGFLGANGAIYALRRENCSSLPTDTIIDDFTMFMNVGLSGQKIIYDIEAIAEEEVAPNMAGEYKRRVRIGMGNYQAFFRMLNALHPKQKWRAFTYFSHKVVRWFTPHFMLLLLLINLFLLDEFIYQILFGLQVLLYLTTFIVVNFYSDRQLPSIIRLPVFLVNMNVALGHGFIKYTVGNSEGTWQRTER
jgi:cellulose synthase/poly-beta-1,6-N-acetylglucosamine synthase-like glycosyltransferase